MARKKLPWFKFFPADWLSNPQLSECSLAAQGMFIRLVSYMQQIRCRGTLAIPAGHPLPLNMLGLQFIGAQDQAQAHVTELIAAGLLRKSKTGVIYSPRVRRDLEEQQRLLAGKKGGRPKNWRKKGALAHVFCKKNAKVPKNEPLFAFISKAKRELLPEDGVILPLPSESSLALKGEKEGAGEKGAQSAPGDFPLTPEDLAHAFAAAYTGLALAERNPAMLAPAFADLINYGVPAAELLAAIRDPARLHSEYFGQFIKRWRSIDDSRRNVSRLDMPPGKYAKIRIFRSS